MALPKPKNSSDSTVGSECVREGLHHLACAQTVDRCHGCPSPMQRPPLSPTARPRMQCARRFRAGPAARLDLSAQSLRKSWGRHRGGRSRGSRPPQRDHDRANGGETTLHERRRQLRRCSARVRRYRASGLVQDGAHQHLSAYSHKVSRMRRSPITVLGATATGRVDDAA